MHNIVPVTNQFTNMHEGDFLEFCEEYGPHVKTPEDIIFEDGSRIEHRSTDYKKLIPPPEDKYQLSVLRCAYWRIVSRDAETHFTDYKTYLGGTGWRRPEWCHLYTEDDQLEFLRNLQKEAKRTRSRYLKFKRDVDEYTPKDIKDAEQADIDSARRTQEFLSQLDDINI